MNRKDLQKLSKLRLEEAEALFSAKHYDGAYYLAGYSIECAIKAVIAKSTRLHDFPDSNRVSKSHDHNLANLIKVAELGLKLREESTVNPDFKLNWSIVEQWSVNCRYEHGKSMNYSKDLLEAVSSKRNGVLVWLKKFW